MPNTLNIVPTATDETTLQMPAAQEAEITSFTDIGYTQCSRGFRRFEYELRSKKSITRTTIKKLQEDHKIVNGQTTRIIDKQFLDGEYWTTVLVEVDSTD